MQYFLGYSRYGINLEVPKDASKEQILEAYLGAYGGPQGVLNHFLNHLTFAEDTARYVKIRKDHGSRQSSKDSTD